MFSRLLNYEDYDFWKEHRYIDIKTKDGERKYEIIAAYRTEIQGKGQQRFQILQLYRHGQGFGV